MAALVPDLPQVETTIVALTNEFRREMQLGEVKPNPVLAAAAKAYAEYLARTASFSHTADGRQPADRVRSAGYKTCQMAENLALNRDSRGFRADALARQAVEGWKNSPGHRQNMMAPHMTEIGVGVARGPDQTYLSVQLFGRPESHKYQFQIRNLTSASLALRLDGKAETLRPRMTLRVTQCLPVQLAIETAKTDKGEHRIGAEFQPADGDLFVISGSGSAAVKVERSRP